MEVLGISPDSDQLLLQSMSDQTSNCKGAMLMVIGRMMITSKHTRWPSWTGKIDQSYYMVGKVSSINRRDNERDADEIVVMPPSALAKLCMLSLDSKAVL